MPSLAMMEWYAGFKSQKERLELSLTHREVFGVLGFKSQKERLELRP